MIKEFISDDGTVVVVVGTVIDPELIDEMRVTVIVTGLGEPKQRQAQVQPHTGKARLVDTRRDDGSLDYHQLDRPAVLRNQTERKPLQSSAVNKTKAVPDVDYLDIPAFLRRHEEA